MTSAVPNISGKLSYRLVTPDDLPLLRRLREECGWGRSRLEKYWGSDDRPLCVFTLENEGEVEDIGMGGWILDNEEDPGATSRASGAVGLSQCILLLKRMGSDLEQLLYSFGNSTREEVSALGRWTFSNVSR
jgi:hypothetical protein